MLLTYSVPPLNQGQKNHPKIGVIPSILEKAEQPELSGETRKYSIMPGGLRYVRYKKLITSATRISPLSLQENAFQVRRVFDNEDTRAMRPASWRPGSFRPEGIDRFPTTKGRDCRSVRPVRAAVGSS